MKKCCLQDLLRLIDRIEHEEVRPLLECKKPFCFPFRKRKKPCEPKKDR